MLMINVCIYYDFQIENIIKKKIDLKIALIYIVYYTIQCLTLSLTELI